MGAGKIVLNPPEVYKRSGATQCPAGGCPSRMRRVASSVAGSLEHGIASANEIENGRVCHMAPRPFVSVAHPYV